MKYILIFFIFFLTLAVNAQDFSQLVDSTYDFSPHKLSKKEQETKFPKLDTFFKLVLRDTATYVPLLKTELKKDGHMPYFYYDGAHLLMIINQMNTTDDKLIISSFKKSDIRDLNPRIYTSLLTQLSLRGTNTSDLAIQILQDSTFSFFIPSHAFNFDQGYCLSYILLPLTPQLYTAKLINAFDDLSDESKKSIITTLWFSYSCEGDLFLNSVKENSKYSENIRNYAANLLSRKKVNSETKKIMTEIYGNNLDKLWIDSFYRFSDEAIGNIDYVTRMRRNKEKCR
ncbi:conserved exported protein of unknown function [Tenacibaculum sp. 190130A14a]|uniref:Uncharacterized protein n=1 Tax=Tenacibaculum polynesiense TaxID=3137857 RepID=A0ABP1F1M9_9FLAO